MYINNDNTMECKHHTQKRGFTGIKYCRRRLVKWNRILLQDFHTTFIASYRLMQALNHSLLINTFQYIIRVIAGLQNR